MAEAVAANTTVFMDMEVKGCCVGESLGTITVHNIQTVTGNYIANGYASKNCQYLQNPLQGSQKSFSVEDINYYQYRPLHMKVYIIGDPATSMSRISL